MDRSDRHGSFRNKKLAQFPEIYIDKDADFASVKLAPGVEDRSYIRNGVVICEDDKGRVIEIQLLNLKALLSSKKRLAA